MEKEIPTTTSVFFASFFAEQGILHQNLSFDGLGLMLSFELVS